MEEALRVLHRVEDGVIVTLLGAMITLGATQVVLRNLLHTGLTWGEPTMRLLVLWLGLLGALAATRERRHIAIDVVSRFLPPPARRWLEALNSLLAGTVCAVLAYHGARFVYMDYGFGTLAFARVPAWLTELVIPFGFGAMALRFGLVALLGPGAGRDPPGGSAGPPAANPR